MTAQISAAMRPMRLPRARSTPTSRHWLMQAEAGTAAAESSFGRNNTNSWTAAPMRSQSKGHSTGGSQPYNAGRHRVKVGVVHALGTRDEQAQLRRLQQVTSANQFNKEMSTDVGKANLRAAELARADVPRPPFSGTGERALLGIEKSPLASTSDATSAIYSNSVYDENADFLAASAPAVCTKQKVVTRGEEGCINPPTRHMSLQSEDAMKQLFELDRQLKSLEQQVSQIDRQVRDAGSLLPENVGQIKTALAQLEADANKLETKGVDSIYTSTLVSGQASAKDAKKAQLRRLETLFSLIEDIFRLLADRSKKQALV